jgi:hypothetical protein
MVQALPSQLFNRPKPLALGPSTLESYELIPTPRPTLKNFHATGYIVKMHLLLLLILLIIIL